MIPIVDIDIGLRRVTKHTQSFSRGLLLVFVPPDMDRRSADQTAVGIRICKPQLRMLGMLFH